MRLVAVVAVLAGVLLALGLRCTDGMMAEMPMVHGTNSMVVGAKQDGAHLAAMAAGASLLAHVEASSPASSGMGGVLATCVALLVMVLVAVAGLRPAWLRIFVQARAPGRVAMICAIGLRAPGLAQLCVLRT